MNVYLISNGAESFIRRDRTTGKYVPIRGEKYADTWDERDKAENVLHNCLAKSLQSKYKVVEKCCEHMDGIDENTCHNKQQAHYCVYADNELIGGIDRCLEQIENMLDNVPILLDSLRKDLKQIEEEKLDARHYIEFGSFNASLGYKAMKTYQDILRRRRSVKKQIAVLETIANGNIELKSIQDIRKNIYGITHQIYTPRVLFELFENLNNMKGVSITS